ARGAARLTDSHSIRSMRSARLHERSGSVLSDGFPAARQGPGIERAAGEVVEAARSRAEPEIQLVADGMGTAGLSEASVASGVADNLFDVHQERPACAESHVVAQLTAGIDAKIVSEVQRPSGPVEARWVS